MKIALLGYGTMGREIEAVAIERNHKVVLKIDKDDKDYDLRAANVAIDFSVPDSAYENICTAIGQGVPVVSGTTGWLENYEKVVGLSEKKGVAFLYASNFSLGVNLFFALNDHLAKIMAPYSQYAASITETHHTRKLDAPSGTAISLAKGILANSSYKEWQLKSTGENVLPIHAKREGDIPGIHEIDYTSEEDRLSIRHEAHGRRGFALGAVMAAEWILGRQGVFTMKDVLNLG